jgi:DNA-binding CsgD family transcriptional regulator
MRMAEHQFLEAVTSASEAVGSPGFDGAMLALARSTLAHDTHLTMRLHKSSAPATITVEGISEEVMRTYETDLYRDDPIHIKWAAGAITGVHGLHKVEYPGLKESSYYRDFLSSLAHISDELGIILPGLGNTALGIWLQRSKGVFKGADFSRVQRVFPLMANLNRAHQFHVASSIHTLAESETSRVPVGVKAVNSFGVCIYQDSFWRNAALKLPNLDDIASGMRCNNRASLLLENGRLLQRISINDHHALGHGGTLFVIQEDENTCDHEATNREACWDKLTLRESEIVRLILAGYPNALIADKLSLAVGTVKNYRSRLYYKLDVTTERELILMFNSTLAS